MFGSVFGRADFIFEPPDFSHRFCGESAQKNPPGKSPTNPPNVIQQKSPTIFCRGGRPNCVAGTRQNSRWLIEATRAESWIDLRVGISLAMYRGQKRPSLENS